MEKLDNFKSARGLRQGDLLSPYIFVICMEVLGHTVQTEVENGVWKAVAAARRALKVSHLFFANDLLLFGEASLLHAKTIDEVLQEFFLYFGMKVNLTKPKVWFSKNIRRTPAHAISL